VHLAATRLLERELDGMAEPFEQTNDRPPGRGMERVVEARDEERDRQTDELTAPA
jgi:hypothetical protein